MMGSEAMNGSGRWTWPGPEPRAGAGRRVLAFAALLVDFLLAMGLAMAVREQGTAKLPPAYQKWLETDVVYIISPAERDVFLKLSSDRERDVFIEAFWRQRDPTPGTPENEFKTEHYRRLNYANERLGRETARPGWQTDRGRISILLGPPSDISDIQGSSTVQPSQIWSYEGKTEYGLPGHFNLVFFKRDGIGEYVLYSPNQDGPGRLLVNSQNDPTDRESAYLKIQAYDARLAEASLSLLGDESAGLGRPSLSSERLVQQIAEIPEKMVDAKYTDAFLKYKDIVDVEYSANYVPSESALGVFEDSSGVFFVHYTLEPKRLSILAQDDRYKMNFVLDGILRDDAGRVVFQYEKTIPLDFGKNDVEEIRKTSLALQDMIPVIPGDFGFSVLVKNTFSKEFMSAEGRVSIPAKPIGFQIGPLLLGYRKKIAAAPPEANKPFKFGPDQISFQAVSVFQPKENVVVFFQVFGLEPGLAETGVIRFAVMKDAAELSGESVPLSGLNPGRVMREIPLRDLAPGFYKIKVSVLDSGKKEKAAASKDFAISALADVPRPWIVSRVMPGSSDAEYAFILGTQSENAGRPDEAERFLRSAFERNRSSLKYALGLGQVLLKKKDFNAARGVLDPFLDEDSDGRLLSLLGAAHEGLGEYKDAVDLYERTLARGGANLAVLNSIGVCYYRLGNYRAALEALEKSLEINPNQESILRLVSEIKQKK